MEGCARRFRDTSSLFDRVDGSALYGVGELCFVVCEPGEFTVVKNGIFADHRVGVHGFLGRECTLVPAQVELAVDRVPVEFCAGIGLATGE